MSIILSLLASAVAVLIASYVLPGVKVDGFGTALVVAVVFGLLNAVVKPILQLLTLPITILTLGLFLLIINVIIVYITDKLVSGFSVSGFISALLFSFLVSIVASVIGGLIK